MSGWVILLIVAVIWYGLAGLAAANGHKQEEVDELWERIDALEAELDEEDLL